MMGQFLTRRMFLALTAAVFLSTALGCGGPTLAEVQGTVTHNGKGLSNVLVQFHPDPEKGTPGPSSSATTDANGHFVLACSNNKPGAVVGWHRVVVLDLQEDRPPQGQPQKTLPRVNAVYTSPASTNLRPEVKAGGMQTIDVDLKLKP